MQTRRDVFQAIADPIRRDIIGLVARQTMNLNSIAENFSVSRPAISQHIKVLTECGLVIIRQQGRERYCEARLTPLGQVADWIEPFRENWERQFTALDQLLDQLQSKQTTSTLKATKNNLATQAPQATKNDRATRTPKATKNDRAARTPQAKRKQNTKHNKKKRS